MTSGAEFAASSIEEIETSSLACTMSSRDITIRRSIGIGQDGVMIFIFDLVSLSRFGSVSQSTMYTKRTTLGGGPIRTERFESCHT